MSRIVLTVFDKEAMPTARIRKDTKAGILQLSRSGLGKIVTLADNTTALNVTESLQIYGIGCLVYAHPGYTIVEEEE